MGPVSFLALSVAVAAPDPGPHHPERWVTTDDYPMAELRRETVGIVVFELFVQPDGRPESCKAVLSTGSDTFGRTTCSLMMKRAKFEPATDENNAPVYGLFRSTSAFTIGGKSTAAKTLKPDYTITVKALPKDVDNPTFIQVFVLADEKGAAVACSRAKDEKLPQLADLACRQVLQLWQPIPRRNAAGTPVRYVGSYKVSFELAK